MNSIPNGWGTKESFPKRYSFSYEVLEASTLVSKALKLVTGSKTGPVLTAPNGDDRFRWDAVPSCQEIL